MDTSEESELSGEDKEQARQVAKSTATMSIATLVSRATGFIRTWAMAFALGNTILASSYSLANNLPNMIYELVAGGVLSTAFLPIYLQQRNMRGKGEAGAYASNLLSIAVVFLGLIALLASVFAPQVMMTQTLFSSADNATVSNAVWLFRFFAFEIVFYGISAVFGGLLNAERLYFWPAVSSIFMNIVTIITFFGYPFVVQAGETIGLAWLAIGSLLSIAAMAFVQLPALIKSGFHFHPIIDFHGEGFRETMRLALPAIACTAINLVSLSFMNSCALSVADNGPSSVSYAWMWYQFPYGVLGVALSTAMFTEMSDSLSRGDTEGFKKHLNLGLRTTWLLIIPMAAMLFACANQLIGLYAAGRFTAGDIAPIAALLRGWAVALPLYAGYMYLYRAFSSLKDLKTVAFCNFFLTFVQVGFYLVLTGTAHIPGIDFGLVGIAMGDAAFYTCMTVALLLVLHKRVGSFKFGNLARSTAKVSAASLLGGGVTYLFATWLATVINMTGVLGNLLGLIICGVFGLALIFVLCRLLHVSEIQALVTKIRGRIHH